MRSVLGRDSRGTWCVRAQGRPPGAGSLQTCARRRPGPPAGGRISPGGGLADIPLGSGPGQSASRKPQAGHRGPASRVRRAKEHRGHVHSRGGSQSKIGTRSGLRSQARNRPSRLPQIHRSPFALGFRICVGGLQFGHRPASWSREFSVAPQPSQRSRPRKTRSRCSGVVPAPDDRGFAFMSPPGIHTVHLSGSTRGASV